jgi:hypothetical protein
MTNKNEKKDAPLKHENHSLHTRRDFLSQGFMAGMGLTMLPGLLTMIQSNSAQALDCGFGNQTNITRTPILIFDLAGGANLIGSNVMVGKAGGQLDFAKDYTTLGLPASMHPSLSGQTNNELGLVFHNDSAILRGIKAGGSAAVRAKVDGGVFCAVTSDDTSNNQHNPMYWLAAAGANGKLASLAGSNNSMSGGNSMAPTASIISSLKPVIINNQNDAIGLVNVGRLGTLYGADKTQKILKTIENMSAQKLKQFNSKTLPDQIKDLMNCGYIKPQDILANFTSTEVDPSQDPLVLQAFPAFNTNGDHKRAASMAKLVLDGYVGVGTVEKGGYDYHDNTRATGEVRDAEIGEIIGRVMELASLKGKNILIYVITDGGINATQVTDDSTAGRGKLRWGGDSSQRSSSFMLLYRHAGKATLRTANMRQVGAFKDDGTVNTASTLVSNSVTTLSKALVANYLALHGAESKLASVVGDNPFGSNLNNYLFFNKIV